MIKEIRVKVYSPDDEIEVHCSSSGLVWGKIPENAGVYVDTLEQSRMTTSCKKGGRKGGGKKGK